MEVSPSCCSSVYSTVGASILNCNFVKIKEEVDVLVKSGINFVHLDVMDGNFVADITFGPSFVKNLIQEFPGVKFEVHMMVQHPMNFIQPMAAAGVERYIFHYEVTKEADAVNAYTVSDLVNAVVQHKMRPSIAINPITTVDTLFPYLDLVQSVLVMTVVPGLGGQKFMQDMMLKVKELRARKPSLDIELDGGVSPANIEICGEARANRAVVGTALLRSTQKSTDVKFMLTALFGDIEQVN